MVEINPLEASELIESNAGSSDFTILDVRSPDEFAAGHIQGARLEPGGAGFAAALAKYDKDHTYLVYCYSGGRSGNAARQMENQGFGKVFNLAGGIAAWQNSGLPIER